jgi:hypothetical protein
MARKSLLQPTPKTDERASRSNDCWLTVVPPGPTVSIPHVR